MENYQNLFSLDNKTALITGGTGGLGSAIALGFLQQGADVAVCGGHPEKAAGLADYAAQAGRKFLSLRCDIQKQADIDRMLDEIEEQFGTLDILVNSAGMNRLLPAEDYGEEAFDQVMGLNVKGLKGSGQTLHDSQELWQDPEPVLGKELYRYNGKLHCILCQQRCGEHVHQAAGLRMGQIQDYLQCNCPHLCPHPHQFLPVRRPCIL